MCSSDLRKGEVSLVYFNGVLSHAVEKAPMLHPSFRSTDQIHEEIVTAREPSEQEWLWGERVRKAIHALIKEVSGRDIQLLFNRVDVVGDGQGDFYLMEVSLIDAGLPLLPSPARPPACGRPRCAPDRCSPRPECRHGQACPPGNRQPAAGRHTPPATPTGPTGKLNVHS